MTLTNSLSLLFLSKTVKGFVVPTSWLDRLLGYLKTSAQAYFPHTDTSMFTGSHLVLFHNQVAREIVDTLVTISRHLQT